MKEGNLYEGTIINHGAWEIAGTVQFCKTSTILYVPVIKIGCNKQKSIRSKGYICWELFLAPDYRTVSYMYCIWYMQ